MSFFNLGVVSVGKNPFDMVGGFVAGAAKAAADTAGDAVNAAAKAANDAGKVAGGVANAAGKAAGDAANAAGKAAHDAEKVAEGIAGEVGKAAEGAACVAVGAAEKAGGEWQRMLLVRWRREPLGWRWPALRLLCMLPKKASRTLTNSFTSPSFQMNTTLQTIKSRR